MENIENLYKHFVTITHGDRIAAALLVMATQLSEIDDGEDEDWSSRDD